jgi:hypothetical protein
MSDYEVTLVNDNSTFDPFSPSQKLDLGALANKIQCMLCAYHIIYGRPTYIFVMQARVLRQIQGTGRKLVVVKECIPAT